MALTDRDRNEMADSANKSKSGERKKSEIDLTTAIAIATPTTSMHLRPKCRRMLST